MSDTSAPFQLRTDFSSALFQELVNYPLLVEQWKRLQQRRFRTAYESEFTAAEREQIEAWRQHFHRWYLVSGPPQRVNCPLAELELLQRAVHFFAVHS